MNSLESRIHDAAAAAAEQVRPGDIAPLRLRPQRRRLRWPLGAAGSRPARTGCRPPHPSRRWLTPLTAAISVAMVVACLAVLRHAQGSGQGAWATSGSVSRAQALLAKRALDAYFPATGAQYTAGLAFEWTRHKILAAGTGPCLARAGFPQPPFSSSRRQFILSAPDNGRFPDLGQRTRTHSMTPGGDRTGAHRVSTVPHARQRAPARAVLACEIRHARPIWRLDKTAEPLARTWLKKVGKIQASAPVLAARPGFVSCLEAFGIPARYARSRGTGTGQLFAGFFSWMDRLRRASTSQARFARQQRLWTPVFVTCARPAVTTMERLQLAERSRFFAAHAGQIRAITRLAIGLRPGR